MQNKRVLIIGEIFVDVHLDLLYKEGYLTRLGGIFHAVRACAAMNVEYAFAFYSPSYLSHDINKFSLLLKSLGAYQLGIIERAPNIFLINGSDESGHQGYSNILSRQAEYKQIEHIDVIIKKVKPTDIVIFPGRYNTKQLLESLKNYKVNIHIDINYDSQGLLDEVDISITTCLLSTSTDSYADYFHKDSYDELINCFNNKDINQLVVKENKGGSWCYFYKEKQKYEAPAYLEKVMHSVGVGDVFNIMYILDLFKNDITSNLRFAALCSVAYARTMDYNIFRQDISVILKDKVDLISIAGIRVPWYERKNINIYMAAPDFDYVDVKQLDLLASSLEYHNFKPRLPIRENGLVTTETSLDCELSIYYKDIKLLKECEILIATFLYNDQGTIAEIGMFYQMGKPVIIYDPYKLVENMFLKNSCNFYCTTISETVNSVFLCSNKKG